VDLSTNAAYNNLQIGVILNQSAGQFATENLDLRATAAGYSTMVGGSVTMVHDEHGSTSGKDARDRRLPGQVGPPGQQDGRSLGPGSLVGLIRSAAFDSRCRRWLQLGASSSNR